MAFPRRNQEHLGIDANVLVAYLDGAHPSHGRTTWLANQAVALNPTVVHEAYHALVFRMQWSGEEASKVLLEALNDERVLFINQSLRTTKAGLQLAVTKGLGGRDALILANFLHGRVTEFVTFDKRLLALKKLKQGKHSLTIRAPDA